MKDLEKIKSEDLACQVADANPANFAIEQEVAQLVGATVPQPTEPSADDARELGAQLLVFLRRALLPIRSALRTALAAIYAHLDSRCTDYTPAAYVPYQPLPSYDPMGTPPTPRTLPNLLTALTAFSARKISNGSAPSDGIPDGMSLARLLCDTSAANSVTEIVDDNYGWTWDKALPSFPYQELVLNCKHRVGSFNTWGLADLRSLKFIDLVDVNYPSWPDGYNNTGIFNDMPALTELEFPKLEVVTIGSYGSFLSGMPQIRVLTMQNFREWRGTWNGGILYNMTGLEELYLPEFRYCGGGGCGRESFVLDCPELWKVVVGYGAFGTGTFTTILARCPKVIHFEFLHEVSTSQNLNGWSPTNALDASRTDLIEQGSTAENNLQQFLLNFRDYIAERLTDNGSGKTLTLSQAVRNAIHAAEDTYGIENIIITQKGWTISPAPN